MTWVSLRHTVSATELDWVSGGVDHPGRVRTLRPPVSAQSSDGFHSRFLGTRVSRLKAIIWTSGGSPTLLPGVDRIILSLRLVFAWTNGGGAGIVV